MTDMQMPDRVEEVTVRCQEDCVELLSLRKDRPIADAFPASPPKIKHPMPHFLENPDS